MGETISIYPSLLLRLWILPKSKRAGAGEISHHVRLIYSRLLCFTLAWPVVVRLHMSQRVGNRWTASGCMHQAIENIEAFSLFQSFNLRSIFFYCNIGLVHFAEKTSLNTIPADLLWEKNTILTKKIRIIRETNRTIIEAVMFFFFFQMRLYRRKNKTPDTDLMNS